VIDAADAFAMAAEYGPDCEVPLTRLPGLTYSSTVVKKRK
jgi:hypothetical protein